ncbi:MSCRAMM family protein [Amylolactobacillus amylophilus]|uniref:MSCRAMM family protein n=1 Tax=Amylolactobacillus amylophilus TaxID=1603 RepID=UPI00209389C6|nr:SpaA isopeptide-forming pilin-related protein [Amylolactobacillus amylophilus]
MEIRFLVHVSKSKKKDENGNWIVQKFYNPKTSGYVDTLETGSKDMEIYDGVFQSLGKIKLTQLTYGTYRWKETSAPDGYEMKQTYFPDEKGFVVNYENHTVTTEAENKKLYQLELTKTDSDTKQPLNDVPFIISKTVKTENENDKQYYLKLNADTTGFEWTEDKTVAKQFLTGKSYLLGQDGTVTEQIGEAGKIIVKYFPDAPNLSWKEVSVPAGYDSSGPLTGDFTPSTNGYVYSATQTNKPKDFVLTLEKLSSTFQKKRYKVWNLNYMIVMIVQVSLTFQLCPDRYRNNR